ncbi:MAG: GNAT family N-acetyltransferase [Muribaculaceae bacterium]
MEAKLALTLRAPEPSDIDIIYRWENDPTLWHNSLTPPLTSRQQIWEYVHNFTGDIARDGSLRLMIQPDDSADPAGTIDICDFNRRGNAAFVSIYIDPAMRGRHIATEALSQALTLSREALGLETLAALIRTDNEISKRLFTADGFTRTGILPDWLGKDNDLEIFCRKL